MAHGNFRPWSYSTSLANSCWLYKLFDAIYIMLSNSFPKISLIIYLSKIMNIGNSINPTYFEIF